MEHKKSFRFINIYFMGESEIALEYIPQVGKDLPDEVRKTIRNTDHESNFYPIRFHVTSFNYGWYTNHIIMLRPEQKTGEPLTRDYLRDRVFEIRNFTRNQNYKNPVVINVYLATFPLDADEVKSAVNEVLSEEKYIHAQFI